MGDNRISMDPSMPMLDSAFELFERDRRQKQARARAELAIDLFLSIVYVIAKAHERAHDAVLWFHAWTRIVLRAWCQAPTLLELDIEIAPFGVDLDGAPDDAAARFALLELG